MTSESTKSLNLTCYRDDINTILSFVCHREQCEDRAYRIGQTKKVNVSYHDVPLTIDEVMRE